MINYDEIEITKLLVFGTNNPSPDDYNEHIRPTTATPASITYSMSDYMTNGGGRFAYPSLFGVVETFFTATLPDNTYDITTLQSQLGTTFTNADFIVGISQYGTGILSSDHPDRSYIFGTTSFRLDTSSATFEVVNGVKTIRGIEVRAFDDNFDFDAGNPLAELINTVALEPTLDPYELARGAVEINFTGTGTTYANYSQSDFNTDQSSEINVSVVGTLSRIAKDAAGIASLATSPFYLSNIANDPFLSFKRGDLKVIYGTPNNDTLTTSDAELSFDVYFGYLIVGGDGNDNITGGIFADELQGGNGNDALNGGLGDDTFIGGAGNDQIEGGFGDDTAIYSDVVANYEFAISDDGETVTISHPQDGTDTLTNVEFGQFSDQTVQLLGNKLSFVNDFVVGTTQDTEVVFNMEREGDTSFPVTIFVDGEVSTGNAFFNDFPFTLPQGENPSLIITASVSEAFGDVAFSFEISIQDDNPLSGLILVEDNDASGLLIGDQVDDPGGWGWGDPHLITFDNVAYDFQASGDFILARATSGAEYEVQVRFVALSSAVSVTEAMATSIAGTTVSLEANGSDGTLLIDGNPTTVADGSSITVGTGSISRTGQRLKLYMEAMPQVGWLMKINHYFLIPLNSSSHLQGL